MVAEAPFNCLFAVFALKVLWTTDKTLCCFFFSCLAAVRFAVNQRKKSWQCLKDKKIIVKLCVVSNYYSTRCQKWSVIPAGDEVSCSDLPFVYNFHLSFRKYRWKNVSHVKLVAIFTYSLMFLHESDLNEIGLYGYTWWLYFWVHLYLLSQHRGGC